MSAAVFAEVLATEAERAERVIGWPDTEGDERGVLPDAAGKLPKFLPPGTGKPVRRFAEYLVPTAADLPAVAGRVDRLFRTGDGWLAAGVAAATAAEVAGTGLPDRLAPRLWAERRSLGPLGGGEAVVLLADGDGNLRLAKWDGREDGAVFESVRRGVQP